MEITLSDFIKVTARTCGRDREWLQVLIVHGLENEELTLNIFTEEVAPTELARLAQAINEIFGPYPGEEEEFVDTEDEIPF